MAFLNKAGVERLWMHIISKIGEKVDKVEGKGLSTNDFTDEDKERLDNLSGGQLSLDYNNLINKPELVTVDESLSIAGKAADAMITGEALSNLRMRIDEIPQSDWEQTNEEAKDFIKNKPEIPSIEGLASMEYVNQQVSSIVGSAPETLNTLNELSTALGEDPNFATTVVEMIGHKVDKVDGKDLSTNDFTTEEKEQLALIVGEIGHKVDRIEGKGLSANDYTDEDKNKLDSIAEGAEVNVQPDWNQNDPNAADYVKNRTHWVETALVEEVPETEITTEVGNGFASAHMDASVSPSATEEGEIRTIVFDGKEYECAMFIAEGPAFGNGALIPNDSQFPDTGEPFMYMYMPDGGGMVLTRDTTPATHTIACYKKEETVHTIDPKFLPDCVGTVKSVNGIAPDENGAIESYHSVSFNFADGSAIIPGLINYYGTETMAELCDYYAQSGMYNVECRRMIMTNDNPMRSRNCIGNEAIKDADGNITGQRLFFGDDLCPVILDIASNKIILDPDWVAPTPCVKTVNGVEPDENGDISGFATTDSLNEQITTLNNTIQDLQNRLKAIEDALNAANFLIAD